jgi:hypothetical protein
MAARTPATRCESPDQASGAGTDSGRRGPSKSGPSTGLPAVMVPSAFSNSGSLRVTTVASDLSIASLASAQTLRSNSGNRSARNARSGSPGSQPYVRVVDEDLDPSSRSDAARAGAGLSQDQSPLFPASHRGQVEVEDPDVSSRSRSTTVAGPRPPGRCRHPITPQGAAARSAASAPSLDAFAEIFRYDPRTRTSANEGADAVVLV